MSHVTNPKFGGPCPHRGEVIGQHTRRDGDTEPIHRCSHPLNNQGAAVQQECSTCGGARIACEICPWYDSHTKKFRYPPPLSLADIEAAKRQRASEAERMAKLRPRFVRTTELVEAALSLAGDLPRDAAVVAGVPRSGMIPAAALATHLGLPLGEMTKEGRLTILGNGHRQLSQRGGRVVVVDDTVYSGHQLREIRARYNKPAWFVAIFATPPAVNAGVTDQVATVLPSPHLLEWNLFNGSLLAGRAVDTALTGGFGLDLDGLLCENPPEAACQDPESFEAWVQRSRPTRWRVTSTPIPLIVTARLERYREPTLAWLDRHHMRVERLIMHPGSSERDRDATNVAAWKADQLRRLEKRWYVESNTIPARELSLAWPEGFVIDIESGRVFP